MKNMEMYYGVICETRADAAELEQKIKSHFEENDLLSIYDIYKFLDSEYELSDAFKYVGYLNYVDTKITKYGKDKWQLKIMGELEELKRNRLSFFFR